MPGVAGRVAMVRQEQALAPPLAVALEIRPLVLVSFKAHRWGMFTRDVRCPADQLTPGRLQAKAALDLTGEILAMASAMRLP